jgi:predicted glycogen debranching enzyme
MTPAPGTQLLRFVGDRLRVTLEAPARIGAGARGFLRTNLTRAALLRAGVLAQAGLREQGGATFAGAAWRDIPLERAAGGWAGELPLLEVGSFRAKPYCTDAAGRQHWPVGGDIVLSVHPNRLRTANTLYCAFVRTAGGRDVRGAVAGAEAAIRELDARGFSVIPPSGTLRGLVRALPHVFDTLGCRVLQLLPIGPVPTSYGRRGRYGSPYAALDLTAIDPALVEFDRSSTAVDQFQELADAVDARDGLLLLDVVLNHTGWGSRLMEEHPEWFERNPDGSFHSPGAWGVTWHDLVELDTHQPALWEVLAEALLTWCRRGVDGFRCDAGYMIPLPAWQYVVARVRTEFPECVFLLEGLGGAWEVTERLLCEGGMQWAYSELFQCFAPRHVAEYLDHALPQSERVGLLVHFSETHDNDRLAARGARWSALRNRLCALASVSGGFGFSAGVEWLCAEKLDVSEARTLSWGAEPNLVAELGRLNRLLADHPCFFDGAGIERLSAVDSPVLALERSSRDGADRCLVLVNLDPDRAHAIELPAPAWVRCGSGAVDLLGSPLPPAEPLKDGVRLALAPGAAHCLAAGATPSGLSGDAYRSARAQAAWAQAQIGAVIPHEAIGPADFCALAAFVAADPVAFLASLAALDPALAKRDLLAALSKARAHEGYARVIEFRLEDARRITPVPPGHWLLFEDAAPFALTTRERSGTRRLRSVAIGARHVATLPPAPAADEHDVALELRGSGGAVVHATLRRLSAAPRPVAGARRGLVMLTNGRGAMARLQVDLGAIESKYDCLLGANLDPRWPGDRHVFVKRVRAWVNADGFLTPLAAGNLWAVDPGQPAVWNFHAFAGDGRSVGVRIAFELLAERNALVMRLSRTPAPPPQLPADRSLLLTLRFDLEDRSFHAETHAGRELKTQLERSAKALPERPGFVFTPGPGRSLRVWSDRGAFHPEREWCHDIPHPADAARGVGQSGDAFSPGWFEIPLADDAPVTVVLCADPEDPPPALATLSDAAAREAPGAPSFEAQLRRAAAAFLVRRGPGRSVIAGYPWFLDWGRDSCVAARGIAAAGWLEQARDILLTQAAFERSGTLPNFLTGEREGSRETSDAPLWLALACEELAGSLGPTLYAERVEDGRTLGDVLASIGAGYLRGCENGVGVDPESGLVFSPAHFTWMDTSRPAATPREGYPIEINALWIRLLRQLERIGASSSPHDFGAWAERAERSFERFWRAELGFCADTLHAARGVPASKATPDAELRPNQLLPVSLGLIDSARARAIVAASGRELVVPGALRSLAPRAGPLYRGRYEGDEERDRKPAYHNGTAWVWWLPIHCEALVRAHDGERAAVDAARALLGSTARLLGEGCLGQLPEVLDGDAPHTARGCDAQAWSVTETLRVWLALERLRSGASA